MAVRSEKVHARYMIREEGFIKRESGYEGLELRG